MTHQLCCERGKLRLEDGQQLQRGADERSHRQFGRQHGNSLLARQPKSVRARTHTFAPAWVRACPEMWYE